MRRNDPSPITIYKSLVKCYASFKLDQAHKSVMERDPACQKILEYFALMYFYAPPVYQENFLNIIRHNPLIVFY